MLLLTGFGAFQEVTDNPSARLVCALHGRVIAGHAVHAEVLPVSYSRGPARAIELALALQPVAVIGFGVARGRVGVQVERLAYADAQGLDVDLACPDTLAPGAAPRHATLDAHALAEHLGATVSDDAGRYVCNAWLFEVPAALRCPATFVHLPAEGADPELIAAGLAAWLTGALAPRPAAHATATAPPPPHAPADAAGSRPGPRRG